MIHSRNLRKIDSLNDLPLKVEELSFAVYTIYPFPLEGRSKVLASTQTVDAGKIKSKIPLIFFWIAA